MRIYGVLNHAGTHVDISKSLASTKRFARDNGYDEITCRFSYNAVIMYRWSGTRWVEQKSKN